MANTYSIAALAAAAYVKEKRIVDEMTRFECPEGTADIVVWEGESAYLFAVSAKRQRGEVNPPEYSQKRLQRIATCYLVEHPEVLTLTFGVIEAVIGSNATVTINAVDDAYVWER